MTPDKTSSVSTLAISTPAATRTILIVDDDPSVTETFERMLRLEGYHVVTALSAEAGTRWSGSSPWDSRPEPGAEIASARNHPGSSDAAR